MYHYKDYKALLADIKTIYKALGAFCYKMGYKISDHIANMAKELGNDKDIFCLSRRCP